MTRKLPVCDSYTIHSLIFFLCYENTTEALLGEDCMMINDESSTATSVVNVVCHLTIINVGCNNKEISKPDILQP